MIDVIELQELRELAEERREEDTGDVRPLMLVPADTVRALLDCYDERVDYQPASSDQAAA